MEIPTIGRIECYIKLPILRAINEAIPKYRNIILYMVHSVSPLNGYKPKEGYNVG